MLTARKGLVNVDNREDTLVVADGNLVCWSIPKEMLRNGEYIAVYNISLLRFLKLQNRCWLRENVVK